MPNKHALVLVASAAIFLGGAGFFLVEHLRFVNALFGLLMAGW